MKQEYLPIIDLKSRFFGANEGFKFLNSFLDTIKNKNKNKNKINNFVKIYDYRDNSNYEIYFEHVIVYNFIQNFYIEFLVRNKFKNYSWFCLLEKNIYCCLGKNMTQFDIFSDTVLKIFTKALLNFCNSQNKIEISFFKEYIISEFNKLSNDLKESINYTNFILKYLIDSNLLLVDQDCNIISVNDTYIYIDFWVSSANIAVFYNMESDLIFSCRYGFETLLNVIDNYLRLLIYQDSFFQSKELFSFDPKYKECFPFLMNYEDTLISKIPELEAPYDELFKAFFIKKLILNEYCFHSIVMSCFEFYIFRYDIKNVLMEKANPELNLKSENEDIDIYFK